jgi:ComF family protein
MPISAAESADFFCDACEADWQREQLRQCPDCFSEYYRCRCQPRVLQKAGAAAFIKLTPYVEGERASVTNRLISTMKHSPRRRPFAAVAAELAPLLSLALKEDNRVDCKQTVLVHLPRTRRGVRKNGFDQASYLADAISTASGIAHAELLCRLRDGKEQKSLSMRDRAENVKGAFCVKGDAAGLRVILVDDIVTTGAGAAEAVRVLRAAGAAEVLVTAVSYTQKKHRA